MSHEVRIVLANQSAAARLYNEGLEQGVVTTQLEPPPEQGAEVAVLVEAPFAEDEYRLKGLVVHADESNTAIWIAVVPGDLKRLCIGAEETIQPPAGSYDDSRDTVESQLGVPTADGDSADEDSLDESAETSSLASETRDESEDSEPSGGLMPSLSDIGLPSMGGSVAFQSSRSQSSDGESQDRPRDYLSRRLSKQTEARKKRPKHRRWSKDMGRSGEAVDKALKADPFVDSSGIAVPNQPQLRVPGIIAFETQLGGNASYDIFMRVSAKRTTGVAVWDVADGRYWSYLVGGGPVHYVREPELQTESIETLLIRKKFVSEPVLEQARRLATLTGRPLVSVVMRLRLISEAQLFNLRAELAQIVTDHLLDSTSGTVRMYEVPEIREVFQESGSDVLKMLWRHAAKGYEGMDSSAVRAKLEGMMPKFVSLTDEGKTVLHKLPLSSVQQTFVNRLLRPSRPVRKLFARMEMHEVDAARLLLTLQQLGLILLAAKGAENQKDAEIERRLRDRFQRVDKDVFSFLGLHWSALPDELGKALGTLEAEMKQFSTIGETISNYDAMRTALQSRVDETRGLIDKEKDRREYRRRIVDPNEQYMAAETLLKQGELALFRRDREQASECFRRMLEIDPGGSGSYDRRERAKTALMQLEDGKANIPG